MTSVAKALSTEGELYASFTTPGAQRVPEFRALAPAVEHARMDGLRGVDDRYETGTEDHGVDDAGSDRPFEIGTDERRMHVRAYNHWVSLLKGRPYPSIEDLDPGNITDFGPNSVLLDFSAGIEDPSIRYLGRALRDECGVMPTSIRVADVPSRSLLSRLTDHYLQIIANRAPIGFEAEFVSLRGHNTLYRGILMPFSSDDHDEIDFIYGVINWKELVDADTQAKLDAEVETARRSVPRPTLTAPVWADGPSAGLGTPTPDVEPAMHEEPLALAHSLDDRLMLARESAAAARASDVRSRSALYRALGRAYDFALAADDDEAGYAALLERAGLSVQARAPMTPVVKLVFGADYDKTRVTEFAAVLAHAKRNEVPSGGLELLLDNAEGGIKALVQAERAQRKPARPKDVYARAAEELRSRPPLAHVGMAAEGAEFVVLLARAGEDGTLDIVARVDGDDALTERAIRRAAA